MSLMPTLSSGRLRNFRTLIQRAAISVISLIGIGVSPPRTSAQIQQSDNRQNIVYGTVVNAVTHEPISRALVSSPGNRYATLTDGEGHFEFALPKLDSQGQGGFSSVLSGAGERRWSTGAGGEMSWLMARKPGFLDDPNERKQVEASPGSEITITLAPEALIKGRVTISAAEAAAGVNVQIFTRQVQDGIARWVQGASAGTNSNGEFRFAELPPGSYELVTHEWMDNDPVATIPGGQLYGFPPLYYPGATDFPAATTIQLTAGQTYQADLTIVRQPYYPITIPVENSGTSPGVNITVSPQSHHSPGYSLGHNARKQTIEGSLPKGNYLVEGAIYGPKPATGSVNLAVTGAPAEGPSMVLTPNSSIAVSVTEEFASTDWNGSTTWNTGNHTFSLSGPRSYLEGLRLEAADDFEPQKGGSLRQPTRSDDNSLVIENLAPGRYWLRVRPSRGYVASATRDGVDLLHQPLVVGSGSSTPIEIKMRDDVAELDGTVAGVTAQSAIAASTPNLPQAWIYCLPEPESVGQFQEHLASSDGKFNSPNMAPGTYRVMAFKNQQHDLPYRDAEAMKAYESKGQVVHLSPGQKATVQLQLISGSE